MTRKISSLVECQSGHLTCPTLPGHVSTCTLTQDNLMALLETRVGQAKLCQQVNTWTNRHTGGVRGPQRYQDNPNARHHEIFTSLIMGKDKGKYEHITMALLDTENLLQQPAINADLHRSLGIGVDRTAIEARGAKKLAIDIEGISKGIYLKFPNLDTCYKIKPLIVKNLALPLNLGSKFNFEFVLTPQIVELDKKTGLKHNRYQIQGIKGKLFSQTDPGLIHPTLSQRGCPVHHHPGQLAIRGKNWPTHTGGELSGNTKLVLQTQNHQSTLETKPAT